MVKTKTTIKHAIILACLQECNVLMQDHLLDARICHYHWTHVPFRSSNLSC